MPLDLTISPTAPIALVVEDPLTRDYLRAVWGSPADVAFVLGGGNEGVRAIVQTFEAEGSRNVFGVTDRDFRPTNHSDWMSSTKTFRTFVLPVHEIENYLLSSEALQASLYQNRGLDAALIEQRMQQRASGLCWWASCRETIAELKRRFREPFVSDPPQSLSDQASAHAHICASPWFMKLAVEAARSTAADVHALLAIHYQGAIARLADGTWRREFAGKEVLRDVAGWFCDRCKIRVFPQSDSLFHSDLAKEIGAWQASNKTVPQDLTDLLQALRARIVRQPAP